METGEYAKLSNRSGKDAIPFLSVNCGRGSPSDDEISSPFLLVSPANGITLVTKVARSFLELDSTRHAHVLSGHCSSRGFESCTLNVNKWKIEI